MRGESRKSTSRRSARIGLCLLATAGATLIGTSSAMADQLIDCSAPLTHNLTLTDNTDCNPSGSTNSLVIGADHVTVNLNGHGFGALGGIRISGHNFDTIENGEVSALGDAIILTNQRHSTIRNVSATAELGGVLLSGGRANELTGVKTAVTAGHLLPGLQLTGERGDVLRKDSTTGLGDANPLVLAGARRTLVVDGSFADVSFVGANRNDLFGNTLTGHPVSGCCGPPPVVPGIAGTGNRNVIVGNTAPTGISLTGRGNVIFGNH